MPDGQSPATTRRRLRFELRGMREKAGLAQADVVKELDWSLSKLIRIESGAVGVSVTDVRVLLALYKAPDASVNDLVALARTARERRWWSKYRDVITPQLQEFLGFEADAIRLRQFHPTIVPGLLQIKPYIRAVTTQLELTPSSESRADSLVEVRLRRQKEVLESGTPPEFTVVVDEALLHRQVGGVETMRAQLQHIADLIGSGAISFGVIPFAVGSHFGMFGAFHILEFADDTDDAVLYIENAQSSVALQDKPEIVAQYASRFDDLLEVSLRDSAAIDLLRKIGKDMA